MTSKTTFSANLYFQVLNNNKFLLFLQTKEDDVGHIYQDEENQAAILLRTDDGVVLVVSTCLTTNML